MEKITHPVTAWLKRNHRTQPWLAKSIGISRRKLQRHIDGEAPPSYITTTKWAIQGFTGGDVMASDWPDNVK